MVYVSVVRSGEAEAKVENPVRATDVSRPSISANEIVKGPLIHD